MNIDDCRAFIGDALGNPGGGGSRRRPHRRWSPSAPIRVASREVVYGFDLIRLASSPNVPKFPPVVASSPLCCLNPPWHMAGCKGLMRCCDAVQGPASRELLAGIVWTPPTQPAFTDLGWFRFAIGRLGDHNGIPLLVSRTGYSGELGYEIWTHPRHATALWDAVREAGEPFGLTPLGLQALDMLRIESGLVFAGYDFSDQTDPYEAGIGFTVPLKSKEDDFVGREALLARKASPQRTLVGLELEGNEPARHGDCVHIGRSQVGVVTSATRSPILRKNIALCRIAVQFADLGTAVEIGKLDGHQKRIPAHVVRFPFYDPDKTRPRS